MRVLIAARDPAIQRQLEGFFLRRQHEMTTCAEIGQAATALVETHYPVVLIDLDADATGALELCRQIRDRSDGDRTFVLALASGESQKTVRAVLEAGADDCLPKPVRPSALQLRLAIGQRNVARFQRSSADARSSEQRFRTLLETMQEGVLQVDGDGQICLVNSRMSRITGFTADELLGRSADEVLIPPGVRDKLPGQILLGSGTGSEEHTIPLETRDGEMLWIRLTAAPIRHGHDDRTGSLAVIQDVTRQVNAEESLRYREEYFRALLENASDLISILDLDGRILYQSLSSERLLGCEADALIGRDFYGLVHGADRESLEDRLSQVLQAADATASVEIRLRHRDGTWLTFESLFNNLSQNPVVGGLVATSRDVTERRRIEAALDRERALFQQLFESSPAGIVILGDDDRIVDANRSFEDLFQYPVREVVGRQLSEVIVPPSLRDEATRLSELVFGRQTVDHETVRQRKDGTQVDVSILGIPISLPEPTTGAFGIYTDISERKQAERKLFHDASHDALTGLPNRTLLLDRLDRALRRSKRRGDYQFALLFLDLDRFKEVNDSLGHAAGDQLLIETARRLESCLRPGDTTARLAGDEMVMVLDDIREVTDVIPVAERVLARLAKPFELGGQSLEISASIGVVFSASRYQRSEELIRDADLAMYRAKSRGRGCFEIFDPEMQQEAAEPRLLESDLARALENEQAELHFQPIIGLATGRIVAAEALVRWRHPELGLLGPQELLPACESAGTLADLGRWILGQACRQAASWRRQFPRRRLRVSVNLSPEQLLASDFTADVDRLLEAAKVRANALVFEIHESVLVDSPEAMSVLWQLRQRGSRIHVDDFGTGYTALQELYRSPIDTLKVDRSFVARMKPGGEDLEIIRATGALGQSLGLDVVAEGVETEKHLEQVRELGLTHAQGFFFSRALPGEELTALITDDPRW